MPGGKNVIASGRFLVEKVYFRGGMAERVLDSSRRVKLYKSTSPTRTILQVSNANIKLCFKMACLLGRVQTSLALLSLHFAIATSKINFCHLRFSQRRE